MRSHSRHRRHDVDPREDVVVAPDESRDLERRRDEDRAVQPDARRLLEDAHEPSHAIAAVALACDEDGRAPAAVAGKPAAHELGERLEVALVAEVLLRIRVLALGAVRLLLAVVLRRVVLLDDSTEAGADRIDEDKVREREPRLLVVHEPRRHRRQRSVRRELDALRAYRPDVQIRRRRPRAAVEHERHRPVEIGVAGDIRDREDLRRRFVVLPEHEPFRRGGVLDVVPLPGRFGAARRFVVRRWLFRLVSTHGHDATGSVAAGLIDHGPQRAYPEPGS